MRAGASRAIRRGDLLVDDAGAGGDGVGEVRVDRVAGADRGGDAALRPGRRGALADRRGGEHGHRARRQTERAEQAGEPAADDDDVVDAAQDSGERKSCWAESGIVLVIPGAPRLRTSGQGSPASSESHSLRLESFHRKASGYRSRTAALRAAVRNDSALQIDHALDGAARPGGDQRDRPSPRPAGRPGCRESSAA